MGFTPNDLLVFILTFTIGLSIAPAVCRFLKTCFKTIAVIFTMSVLMSIAFVKGFVNMPDLQSPEWNRRSI